MSKEKDPRPVISPEYLGSQCALHNVMHCSCDYGIIVCLGCDGEKESRLGKCAGCKGSGIRTCGKCGGLEKLYEEQPVHIITEH